MKKLPFGLVVLLASTICLGGCMRIWSGGPCYGFGCGGGSATANSQNAPHADATAPSEKAVAKSSAGDKAQSAQGE